MAILDTKTLAVRCLTTIAQAEDFAEIRHPTPSQANIASKLPAFRRWARMLFWKLQSGLQRDLLAAAQAT